MASLTKSRMRLAFAGTGVLVAALFSAVPAAATQVAASSSASTLSAEDQQIIEGLGGSGLDRASKAALLAVWKDAVSTVSADVSLASGEGDVQSITLATGAVVEVGVEPVRSEGGVSARAALTGDYRIWGNNGLIFMEYYVKFGSAGGGATKIVGDPWGMSISSWVGTTWDGKRFNIPQRTETNPGGSGCCAAWVQGLTKVTYPGNIFQAEGGSFTKFS